VERTGIIGQEMPALSDVTKLQFQTLHYIPEYRVPLKYSAGSLGSICRNLLGFENGEGGIRTHEAG
jgi:hypothetical protein